MLILLEEDVRAALARVMAREPLSFLTGRTAAELHLGRRPSLPLRVATQDRGAETPGDGGALELVRGVCDARSRPLLRGAVRIARAETSLAGLCARRGAESGGLRLAASLLQRPSALTGLPLELDEVLAEARRFPDATARRRVGYLLERAGQGEAGRVLRPRGAQVAALCPHLPREGPRLARWQLILNTADGFPSGKALGGGADETTEALAGWLAAQGPEAAVLAVACALGVPLTAARCRALGLGRAGQALLERLRSMEFLEGSPAGVPRPPFDGAARLVTARLPIRRRVSVLTRLSRTLSAERAGNATAWALLAAVEARATDEALRLAKDAGGVLATAELGLLSRASDALAALAGSAAVPREVLERLGRYDELSLRLEAASAPPTLVAQHDAWVERARVAWKRGRVHEATAHLAAAERIPCGVAHELSAELLRATLEIEQGRHERARERLRALVETAQAAGRDDALVHCFHRLGTLAAREGRLEEGRAAYRAALDASSRLVEPSPELQRLSAILKSNLALTSLWLGRNEEADALAEAAVEEKRRVGSTAEVVVTQILRARVARAMGRPVPPEGRMAPLVEAALATGDRRLVVEAWLDFAEERARAGDLSSAEEAVGHARATAVALAGAEPILDALVTATSGLVRSLGPRARDGLGELEEAVERLEAMNTSFYAARARRDAATAAEAAGDSARAETHLERLVALVAERRFVLGEHAQHVALYAFGCLSSAPRVRAHSCVVLDELGPSVVQALLRAQDRGGLLESLVARSEPGRDSARDLCDMPHPGGARLRGPTGTRWLTPAEVTELERGVRGSVVIDHRAERLILPDGRALPMARRRILLPLLECLGRARGEFCSVGALASEVWESRDSTRQHAALKVSVSRLRALLGPSGRHVEAGPTAQGPGYRLASELAVLVLDAGPRALS